MSNRTERLSRFRSYQNWLGKAQIEVFAVWLLVKIRVILSTEKKKRFPDTKEVQAGEEEKDLI